LKKNKKSERETEDRKQDDSNIGPLEKRISRAVGFVFIILFWKIIFC
jgi:hypothetical protein